MNHLNEGELRAYLDQEVAADHAQQVQQHLAGCADCADVLAQLEARSSRLSALWQGLDESLAVPSPIVARNRLKSRSTQDVVVSAKEQFVMQPKRRFQFRYAALATAAMLVVALMFPPVQTWAAQVLGLFRVQRVTVIPVDFSSFSSFDEEGGTLMSEMLSDDVKGEAIGEHKQVGSWDEARTEAGFAVRAPAYFDEAPAEIQVMGGVKMDITLDAERIRTLVSALGRDDISIPDSLDGAVMNVDVPQGVQAQWGDCSYKNEIREGEAAQEPVDCTNLVQIPSPSVTTPPDLDMQAMGQLYLQVLGMSEAEAADFSANLDWTSTLVIPVPRDEGEYREVSVDGVQGTLVRSNYRQANAPYILIWVKDGILYSLSGTGGETRGLEIANSLQ
jgi:hypothetical protein